MKHKRSYPNIILNSLSLLVSLVAIFLCIIRCDPFTFDWMGVMIGILSLLTSVLIGWQIFQALEVNKSLKEIHSIKESIEKKVDAQIKLAISENNNCTVKLINLLTLIKTDSPESTLAEAFRIFANTSSIFDMYAKNYGREFILGILSNILPTMNDNKKEQFTSSIASKVAIEDVNSFLVEFLTYSSEERNAKYKNIEAFLLNIKQIYNNTHCVSD